MYKINYNSQSMAPQNSSFPEQSFLFVVTWFSNVALPFMKSFVCPIKRHHSSSLHCTLLRDYIGCIDSSKIPTRSQKTAKRKRENSRAMRTTKGNEIYRGWKTRRKQILTYAHAQCAWRNYFRFSSLKMRLTKLFSTKLFKTNFDVRASAMRLTKLFSGFFTQIIGSPTHAWRSIH